MISRVSVTVVGGTFVTERPPLQSEAALLDFFLRRASSAVSIGFAKLLSTDGTLHTHHCTIADIRRRADLELARLLPGRTAHGLSVDAVVRILRLLATLKASRHALARRFRFPVGDTGLRAAIAGQLPGPEDLVGVVVPPGVGVGLGRGPPAEGLGVVGRGGVGEPPSLTGRTVGRRSGRTDHIRPETQGNSGINQHAKHVRSTASD